MAQTIGILGGSFDPIHNGHQSIAHAAIEQLGLDRLIVIPNAHSPLKSSGPKASFADRIAMIRLAIAGLDGIEASDVEGRRGGTSYTVDTLRELRDAYPDAEFYLIIGADALRDFHRWRGPDIIRDIARLAYIDREGNDPGPNVNLATRIKMTPVDVSSTAIRDRVRNGLPIDSLVPSSVAGYIAAHNLYAA